MGSGKTTFADILQRQYGFRIVRFASALKGMAATLFAHLGLREADALELITDPELKETPLPELGGKTPRYVMQTIGTEWGRNCMGKDFWVNVAMAKAESLMERGFSVVIDDCRFNNEADAIVQRGGDMIRIQRPGQIVTQLHASEGELNDFPVKLQIVNDSSVEYLEYRAEITVDALGAYAATRHISA